MATSYRMEISRDGNISCPGMDRTERCKVVLAGQCLKYCRNQSVVNSMVIHPVMNSARSIPYLYM
jgi:hypothetical protein